MSNCTTFVTLLGMLAKHYNLVLFDNCGWGLNTRLTGQTYGLTNEAGAITWLTEFVTTAIDHMDLPDKFLLAAHSFGGLLASLYASERPDRVAALFLLSPVGTETYDPTDYDPMAYNEQMAPN